MNSLNQDSLLQLGQQLTIGNKNTEILNQKKEQFYIQ